MARSHARILVSIWTDPDFRDLSVEAQRLYLLLLSQGSLNNAGVVLLTLKRWAAGCAATTTADIEKALAELDERRFVAADDDTEEVLIRSFIRNDGIVKQPQMMKNALREALGVQSVRLRAVLARELRRLDRDDAAFTADQIDPGYDPDPDPPKGDDKADTDSKPPFGDPSETLAEPCDETERVNDGSLFQAPSSLREGFDQGSASLPPGSEQPAELRRGGVGVGSSSSVRSSSVSSAAKRGTRIPDGFAVSQPMVVWARAHCPDVDGAFETEQFVDYWTAKPGKDAVKLDWVRTWQTWMRRSQRDALSRGPRLRAVPAVVRPTDPVEALADLRERGDAQEAARLIGTLWREPAKPPSDNTPTRDWMHARAVEWIDEHADQVRAALTERKTG